MDWGIALYLLMLPGALLVCSFYFFPRISSPSFFYIVHIFPSLQLQLQYNKLTVKLSNMSVPRYYQQRRMNYRARNVRYDF
jgi:hypothetical protein